MFAINSNEQYDFKCSYILKSKSFMNGARYLHTTQCPPLTVNIFFKAFALRNKGPL